MQFIDLAAQQKRIRDKIEANIIAVLDHGKYIMGPEIKAIEDRLAEYTGVKHAIGCASGTDALLLALLAGRIGPGDAVFTSPFTFIATAEVISLLGATPVFVDIEPETFNIDPAKLGQAVSALKANDADSHPLPLTNNPSPLTPKGVIAVDLFGLPADYQGIDAVARKHDLFVIEDAAQSFGAELNGRKACSFGNIACTSFFPAKPLGCYGDGGMCFTDDDELANAMDSLRVHAEYIATMDICVAPHRKDTNQASPVKIFDYMACGKPIIASDIEVIREIIGDSRCALLVPSDSPEHLSDAITTLIEDDVLLNKMSMRARQHAIDNFDRKKIPEDLIFALKNVATR